MAENTSKPVEAEAQSARPKVAFISGPLDPDDEYFITHYKPRIDAAIEAGHSFVIGPVAGIDTLALHYLLSTHISPSRITIYMAHFEYLNTAWVSRYTSLGVNVRDVEDAVTTRERDAAMTENSDYDILRYRTEEEAKALYGSMWWPRVSNTEMNERRRKGIVSEGYVLGKGEGKGEGEESGKEKGRGKEARWLRDRVTKFFKQ